MPPFSKSPPGSPPILRRSLVPELSPQNSSDNLLNNIHNSTSLSKSQLIPDTNSPEFSESSAPTENNPPDSAPTQDDIGDVPVTVTLANLPPPPPYQASNITPPTTQGPDSDSEFSPSPLASSPLGSPLSSPSSSTTSLTASLDSPSFPKTRSPTPPQGPLITPATVPAPLPSTRIKSQRHKRIGSENMNMKKISLNHLVESLTPVSTLPDLMDINAFLMTYRTFTTPQNLVRKLLQRYLVPRDLFPGMSDSDFKVSIEYPIQLRVSKILKQLIDSHWSDFDPLTITFLKVFLIGTLGAVLTVLFRFSYAE